MSKIKIVIGILCVLSINSQAALANNMYSNSVEAQRTAITKGLSQEDNQKNYVELSGSRLDIDIGYEYLDPNDIYGEWKSFNIGYYQKVSSDVTMLYQVGTFSREVEGDAVLGSVGIYKSWNDRMYTFTQVTMGSHIEYLPSFRIDNDINYLFGEEKNIVGLIGMTYINQYDEHEDFIVSAGVTYYQDGYNIGYRAFLNRSDPGKLYSTNHVISLGIGHEKDQWIYLDLSYGNPTYLSTIPNDYQTVNNDAFSVSLKYRKWLDDNSGFYAQTSFFDLSDEYQKYEFRVGYFVEFK